MPQKQLHIRRLTPAVLDTAMRLKDLVGWNQTLGDIRRLIDYEPEGCFIAELDGEPVGTISTTSYGTALAWIGMMLVHPDYRRRGIARSLMTAALDYLGKRSVSCIKLDATPLGQPLYEQLGFQAEWEFQRWERAGDGVAEFPASGTLSPELVELDRRAFGVDRSKWLLGVASVCRVFTTECTFGMLRPGSAATYLGPVVSDCATEVEPLIVQMLSTALGRMFWDIPRSNEAAEQMAARLGFEPVRQLLRMWKGSPLVEGRPDLQFALLDPTTG
jgi:GNAT superfamily N-acetyltransferase